jgi:hypothetical protein
MPIAESGDAAEAASVGAAKTLSSCCVCFATSRECGSAKLVVRSKPGACLAISHDSEGV